MAFFAFISDEEETTQLRPITLTRQHKGAIRAIRKVRPFFCQKWYDLVSESPILLRLLKFINSTDDTKLGIKGWYEIT